MHLEDCREFLMNTARRLLAADSPSGFTQQAAAVVEQIAEELGYPVRRTNKGNVILSVRGRERGKTVGLCAHIDTLGLMVRSITADGMLMITKIGGPILPTLDGEYCRIYTRGRADVYRHHPLPLSGGARIRRRADPSPGTKRIWRCASTNRCGTRPAWRRWASAPGILCASTPKPRSPAAAF